MAARRDAFHNAFRRHHLEYEMEDAAADERERWTGQCAERLRQIDPTLTEFEANLVARGLSCTRRAVDPVSAANAYFAPARWSYLRPAHAPARSGKLSS